MGNCFHKLCGEIKICKYRGYSLLNESTKEALIDNNNICDNTKLYRVKCPCIICMSLYPIFSVTGKPIEIYVLDNKLFVKYIGVNMSPEDISKEQNMVCKRNNELCTIMFNGKYYYFI